MGSLSVLGFVVEEGGADSIAIVVILIAKEFSSGKFNDKGLKTIEASELAEDSMLGNWPFAGELAAADIVTR